MSNTDYHKVDDHLTAVRALEARLQPGAEVPTGCQAPNTITGMLDVGANDNFPALLQMQMDLALAALACDRTRIVTLQMSQAFCHTYFVWIGVNNEHHAMTHSMGAQDIVDLRSIQTWYAKQLAYMLQRLDSIPEGAGTMLDNTIVVWGNELSRGQTHVVLGAPLVLAGGGGMGLKTGRYIDTQFKVWHRQVLVSVAHALGATGIDHFGNPADEAPGPATSIFG